MYRDPRVPVLSPAYDLVATSIYRTDAEDLALRLGGSKRFEDVSRATFESLARRLGVDAGGLSEEAAVTIERAHSVWPDVRDELLANTRLGESIDAVIGASSARLRHR